MRPNYLSWDISENEIKISHANLSPTPYNFIHTNPLFRICTRVAQCYFRRIPNNHTVWTLIQAMQGIRVLDASRFFFGHVTSW